MHFKKLIELFLSPFIALACGAMRPTQMLSHNRKLKMLSRIEHEFSKEIENLKNLALSTQGFQNSLTPTETEQFKKPGIIGFSIHSTKCDGVHIFHMFEKWDEKSGSWQGNVITARRSVYVGNGAAKGTVLYKRQVDTDDGQIEIGLIIAPSAIPAPVNFL